MYLVNDAIMCVNEAYLTCLSFSFIYIFFLIYFFFFFKYTLKLDKKWTIVVRLE